MDHISHEIAADDLLFRLGTALSPQIIDVCLPEDIAADPWRIPTARHIPHREIADHAPKLDPRRPVITICQKGLKLSQGAAAILRSHGLNACALVGGNLAWFEAGHPRLDLTQAVAPATAWVLPARRDGRAMLAAWIIWRWYDPQASLIWVKQTYARDVASRYDAVTLPDDLPLAETFQEIGLIHPGLGRWCRSVEDGRAPVAALLETLPQLHPADDAVARAAVPLLDAAWMAAREGAQ
ncbi:MAG: rhodanese-like domain-containing protein [Pseudomonadota bacterium]